LDKTVRESKRLTLNEVKAAIAFDQPKLGVVAEGSNFYVRGSYLISESSVIASPAGPITEFDIEIVLPDGYPMIEPKVFELGGRIRRHPDHHINPDGDCCITVWEHWLVNSTDHSVSAFLNGPVKEFFLGQYWHEKTGKWPFGERSHGQKGLIEAYADALRIPCKKSNILYHLRLLSQDWPKGHWLCPCGSRKKLRGCHREEIMALHDKIPSRMAKRMLKRLKSFIK